jgi:hypothetical protein
MNWRKREIMEMAREAGLHLYVNDLTEKPYIEVIEAFAKLVREDEREAYAKVVSEFAQKWWSIHCDSNKHMETTRKAHDDFCALQAAIRAKGDKHD